MAVPRLVASVTATTVVLAFWWALTEPLRFSPVVLYGVAATILFGCGVIAGRLGALASPTGLVFSLLLGSVIGTWMHRSFAPSSAPVSTFGGYIRLDPEGLLVPLIAAALLGVLGGIVGERMLPTRRDWPGR